MNFSDKTKSAMCLNLKQSSFGRYRRRTKSIPSTKSLITSSLRMIRWWFLKKLSYQSRRFTLVTLLHSLWNLRANDTAWRYKKYEHNYCLDAHAQARYYDSVHVFNWRVYKVWVGKNSVAHQTESFYIIELLLQAIHIEVVLTKGQPSNCRQSSTEQLYYIANLPICSHNP